MTSKQIQFVEREKQESSKSEPLPIPTTKESRSYSFSYEKNYQISSSVPNDPRFPPQSFVPSKPLDDSSIHSKPRQEKNNGDEEKSRRLRATTSYREMKLRSKFRSNETLVPSGTTPPTQYRHEKKKRAYSTFEDPSERKLDDSESESESESESDEQQNTPEDKKILMNKKSKSPKDQKLKREGSSKKGEYCFSLNLFILVCLRLTVCHSLPPYYKLH
jgi:hypothetical protein